MRTINLEDHYGHCGLGSKDTNLRNGQLGIGMNNSKEKILVVCCGNCGDYSHINLKKILAYIKLNNSA